MQGFRSIAGKIVIAVLMALLIIPFAFWGMGDMLRVGRSDTTVAEIGGIRLGPIPLVRGTPVSGRDVRDIFARELDQMAQGGQRLTREQAVAFGFHLRAYQQAEQRVLLDHALADLGFTISDDQVRAAIEENPAFAGLGGKFDRQLFTARLRAMNASEAQVVADARRQLGIQQLQAVFGSGAAASPKAAETLYRYRFERRTAEVALLPFASVVDVPTPTAEQLQAFFEAGKASFQVPEYRTVGYVLLRPDDVLAEVSISEEQVRRAYAERKDTLGKPELRDVDQAILESKEKADQVAALVAGGKTLDEATKEVTGRDGGTIKLGEIARADGKSGLPEALLTAAFAAAEGGVAVAQSPFGWHALRVNKVVAGTTPSFEEARAALEIELRKEAAPELLDKMVRDFDRALSRSDNLAEAAKSMNLKYETSAPLDRNGLTAAGQPAIASAEAPSIAKAAFDLARVGDQSQILDDPKSGASYVVRLEKVDASRTPDLKEVEAKATLAWTVAERRKIAEARAKDVADKSNAAADFGAQVRALKLEPRTSKPVTRSEQDAAVGLTPALVRELFALQPGRAAHVMLAEGVAMIRLVQTTAADPSAAADDVRALSTQIAATMNNEILDQLLTALRARYGVRFDNAAFSALFRPDQP